MSTVIDDLAVTGMGRNVGSGSPYVGESFTAVAGTLQQIQFKLGDTFQGTVPFHVLVTTMSGGHPGTVLFESGTITVPNIGGQSASDQNLLVTYTVPVTGVTNLTPGVQYAFVIDALVTGAQGITGYGLHDNYSGGTILLGNNGSITTRDFNLAGMFAISSSDLAFSLTFGVSAPVINAPVNGSATNNVKPAITGTAQPGSTVTILIDGSSQAAGTVTADSTTGAFTFTPSTALTPGSHSVTATATDTSGSVSPLSIADLFTVDLTAPTVNVTASSNPLLAGQSETVSFGFSEAVAGFDSTDVTVTGGTLGAINKVDASHYTATFTTAASDSVNASVAITAGSYQDVAGNVGSAGSVNITGDTLAPHVGVTASATSLQAGQTSTVTFSFSEAVKNFDNNDVTVTGGTLSTLTKVDDFTYTAAFTPLASNNLNGSLVVAANGYQDLAGNSGLGSESIVFTGDTLAPTGTVTVGANVINLAANSTTVTFSFSEAPNDFGAGNISATDGSVTGLAGSGTTYTALFTAAPGTDIANASVGIDGNWHDGNGNAGSATSTIFTVDTVTPTVAVAIDQSTINLADDSATVTFTFSEPPTDFTQANVTATGGSISGLTQVDATTYTATFTAPAGTQIGDAQVTVNGNWHEGNGNPGAGGAGPVFTVDLLAPMVASIVVGSATINGVNAVSGDLLTVTFTEAVTGFDANDLVLPSGVHVSGLASTDGGIVWSGVLTADAGIALESGGISVSMADPWQDLAGNPGTAGATEAPVTLTIDDVAPVLGADTVATAPGGTVGANVLDNDTDADGPLAVTGVSDSGHGAGSVNAAFAGQFGTLTLGSDGTYTYTADNAGAIVNAPPGPREDVFTYAATDAAGNSTATTLTIAVNRPPVAANDSDALLANSGSNGNVLSNDSDPDGDSLTVTGFSNATSGGTTPNASLAGQYGHLTMQESGFYGYTSNNAVALAEGEVAHDLFTYTESDGHGGTASATLDIQVTGHSQGTMEIVSYTAVESVTGDVISGALYDNTGRYSVGSSVTVPGPDNLDGSWTYTVSNIGRADAKHQDVSYSGFAYDFDYLDADTGVVYDTAFGHAGFSQGIDDKSNFSGNDGLGSDGDVIFIGGKAFAIASGKYVVPEGSQASAPTLMKAVTFQAQESVTGDVINGVLFDNADIYSVGSSVTVPGPDNAGGTWTYKVDSIANADARHQDASYNGFVYDLSYRDVDLGTVVSTFYGAKGLSSGVDDRTANYSGNGGLGSDGDLVVVKGQTFAIASGKYVVPEPQTSAGTMNIVTFTGVESVTGDHINGVLFDNQGLYTVGSSVTKPGPDNMGGSWTYTVNSISTADNAHQDASYNGFVYDLTYYDTDKETAFNTVFGLTGLNSGVNDRTANYSGNQGLGSDGDLVTFNGALTPIASGKYVLPDDRRTTVPAGDGQSANLALLTNAMAAFDTTTGQGGTSPIDPSAVTPPPLLTSPHA